MTDPKPWHDTPTCVEGLPGPVCGGPLVPFESERPSRSNNPAHVMCAACGHDYIETRPKLIAMIYWSAGAWAGHQEGR